MHIGFLQDFSWGLSFDIIHILLKNCPPSWKWCNHWMLRKHVYSLIGCSGSWKLMALVGWNWLKRRCFTKNLPVANRWPHWPKFLMFICKYILTSLKSATQTANGTSPFETCWVNHWGTVLTFKANRLHLWFALQFSVFTEKLKIVT